jgi:hypothetical protein
MSEKSDMRGADIIISVLFFILSIWMLVEAFTMPLTDTYAGVDSVWYVSPALMPLIIGAAMMLISIGIFMYAVKHEGLETLKGMIGRARKSAFFNEMNLRFFAVLVPLIGFVFINLRVIDFFLSIVFYLVFTISVFYFENEQFLKKMLFSFSLMTSAMLVIIVFNIDQMLADLSWIIMDLIGLVFIITLHVLIQIELKKIGDPKLKIKYKHVLLMSYITPIVIVPTFRFLLRIPLPKEGVIVNLMAMVYYAIR